MGIKSYHNYFIDKINNEYCNIRILILDPNSPVVELRARDEPDRNPERIREKINLSINYFKVKYHILYLLWCFRVFLLYLGTNRLWL